MSASIEGQARSEVHSDTLSQFHFATLRLLWMNDAWQYFEPMPTGAHCQTFDEESDRELQAWAEILHPKTVRAASKPSQPLKTTQD